LRYIYPLKDGFGLLGEYGNGNYFISLIFLDIYRHTLRKLHTVEYPNIIIDIVVNEADPITFILNSRIIDECSTRICKIVDKTIIIGERIQIGFHPKCFYGKFVYALNWPNEDENDNGLDVRVLNMYI
jgi:hypothetical protein